MLTEDWCRLRGIQPVVEEDFAPVREPRFRGVAGGQPVEPRVRLCGPQRVAPARAFRDDPEFHLRGTFIEPRLGFLGCECATVEERPVRAIAKTGAILE